MPPTIVKILIAAIAAATAVKRIKKAGKKR